MKKEVIQTRLNHWQTIYENLAGAYSALASGKVKQYLIGDRQTTFFDLDVISKEMKEAEKMVDYYSSLLEGKAGRRAFAAVPMDW